ncbi:hypothetical protein [Caballeronia sp. LZ034LL]|uniref:hypothetical protein n=1 Tax=Caballeronia sp. LZ034LL TaxID=3038567 RepID=UPI00286728D7|nr:hypothetical protein [Caballeronia sp. LZ034LL]MDR5839353.1 hypothetical protein [Caballeronia sp. LZ034LL]
MPKMAWEETDIVQKGDATPARTAQGTKEEIKEALNQGRKRPWDGHDDWVKVNYEVPERVQLKLGWLKGQQRIKVIKAFVAEALEREVDKLIARAEKEGY